jgi:hypothetical protein
MEVAARNLLHAASRLRDLPARETLGGVRNFGGQHLPILNSQKAFEET